MLADFNCRLRFWYQIPTRVCHLLVFLKWWCHRVKTLYPDQLKPLTPPGILRVFYLIPCRGNGEFEADLSLWPSLPEFARGFWVVWGFEEVCKESWDFALQTNWSVHLALTRHVLFCIEHWFRSLFCGLGWYATRLHTSTAHPGPPTV